MSGNNSPMHNVLSSVEMNTKTIKMAGSNLYSSEIMSKLGYIYD